MTTLVSLPPFILDAILSFDETAAVLKLWFCGDRTLQYKISTGVTSVNLVDTLDLTKSRLPAFIGHLRALRSLSIDRQDKFLPYFGLDYGKFIQRLPSSLTKLSLSISESIRVLSPNLPLSEQATSPDTASHDTGIDTNKIGWTFATAFPHLEALSLHSEDPLCTDDFALLPPTITHLTLPCLPKDADGDYSSELPRQLLTLKVWSSSTTCASFWDNLPPHITHLCIPSRLDTQLGVSCAVAAQLPPALTRISERIRGAHFTLEALPRGLETFDTRWLADFDETYKDFKTSHYLPNLKEFGCNFLSPQLLRSLPPGVRKVESTSVVDLESFEAALWPSTLTELSLEDLAAEFPLSTLLPSLGLTNLSLYGYLLDITLVTHLPRTLTSLSASSGTLRNMRKDSEIVFPPSLTNLYLARSDYRGRWLTFYPETEDLADGSTTGGNAANAEAALSSTIDRKCLNGKRVLNCFPYHALPQSLLDLNLTSLIPASQLKFLPRRLKSLNVDDIFEDYDYHPSDAIEMEAMRSIFETGSAEGVKESFDWKLLKHTSIATLLPRTLDDISIWADAMASDRATDKNLETTDDTASSSYFGRLDWSQLPPQMSSIWLRPDRGFPGKILSALPLARIKELSLILRGAEEPDLAFLPPHLDGGVTFEDSPNLTPMILTHPCARLFRVSGLSSQVRKVERKLQHLRTEHANDKDSALYLRYYAPDAELIESLLKD